MGAAACPLAQEEADAALAVLARFQAAVLAVSGGPDSMALLHLAADWQSRRGAPSSQLLIATVDHGLRSQSADEAAFVARTATQLGLQHRTLRWDGPKPERGIPAAAREARYRLLADAAAVLGAAGPVAVAVAHTLDDQAETFLMRLKRGSGVDGLSAMARERPLHTGSSVTLVRPLLDIPKSRLIATLQARGAAWVEDPTNQNLVFERPRLRQALPVFEDQGFQAAALAASARRMQKAQEVLCDADARFCKEAGLRIEQELFAELDTAAFARGPLLLRERLLARLIHRFGGATPQPELSEIEQLASRLAEGGDVRATLGGAFVSQGARALRVWREFGRIDPEPVRLTEPGAGRLWDERFWVSAEGLLPGGSVDVRPLGLEALSGIKSLIPAPGAPSRALAALPAFYLGERLIGVPGLSYQDGAGYNTAARPAHTD